MRTAIIIEARMSSRRLPGKHLRPIAGVPMLARLIERLKRARLADVVCLATSTEPEDAALAELAHAQGIAAYRGPLEDVLGRTLGAADSVGADLIVEITGDCPLADPGLIDQAIARFQAGGADYLANMLDRLSYPIGLDIQVYSRTLLAAVDALCDDPALRVHVTPAIYWNGERWRLLALEAPPALARPNYRLCVDTAADFALVSTVFERLLPDRPAFGLADVIAVLDAEPALARSNHDQPDPFECPQTRGPVRRETMKALDDNSRVRAA